MDGSGILVLSDAETVCWYWSVFIKLIIALICFSTGPKVITEQDGILTVMYASLVASWEYISSSSWRQERTASESTVVSTAVMVLVIAGLVAEDVWFEELCRATRWQIVAVMSESRQVQEDIWTQILQILHRSEHLSEHSGSSRVTVYTALLLLDWIFYWLLLYGCECYPGLPSYVKIFQQHFGIAYNVILIVLITCM